MVSTSGTGSLILPVSLFSSFSHSGELGGSGVMGRRGEGKGVSGVTK